MIQNSCLADLPVTRRTTSDGQSTRASINPAPERTGATLIVGVLLLAIGTVLVRLDASCAGTLFAIVGAAIPLFHTFHYQAKRLLDSLEPVPMPIPIKPPMVALRRGVQLRPLPLSRIEGRMTSHFPRGSSVPRSTRVAPSNLHSRSAQPEPADWMAFYASFSGHHAASHSAPWKN